MNKKIKLWSKKEIQLLNILILKKIEEIY
jgi:hypothetical protein